VSIKNAIEDMLKGDEAPRPEVKPLAKPSPARPKRTVGDIYVAMEAQKVYNPQMPSVPKPQAPPANLNERGSSASLDTSGAWGKPKEK
jgi:hypothetical protein